MKTNETDVSATRVNRQHHFHMQIFPLSRYLSFVYDFGREGEGGEVFLEFSVGACHQAL